MTEPPIIESREPEQSPRGDRVLSMSPAAVRARRMRAERKSGGEPPRAPRQGAKRTASRSGGKPRMPRTPKTLYPEISAFLMMANTLVTMTPLGSKYEPTGAIAQMDLGNGMSVPMPEMRQTTMGDELDEMEVAHLAKALDAQCQRSPRFKRYVETFLGAAAGGGIVAIVAIIGARRLARHGVIAPQLDVTLGNVLQGDMSALANFVPSQPQDEAPDPISGERPPVPDDLAYARSVAGTYAFEPSDA